MFEAGTLKLVAAIVILSGPIWLCGVHLPGRMLFGMRLDRTKAQAFGALIGLLLGVGFLLAVG